MAQAVDAEHLSQEIGPSVGLRPNTLGWGSRSSRVPFGFPLESAFGLVGILSGTPHRKLNEQLSRPSPTTAVHRRPGKSRESLLASKTKQPLVLRFSWQLAQSSRLRPISAAPRRISHRLSRSRADPAHLPGRNVRGSGAALDMSLQWAAAAGIDRADRDTAATPAVAHSRFAASPIVFRAAAPIRRWWRPGHRGGGCPRASESRMNRSLWPCYIDRYGTPESGPGPLLLLDRE